MPISQQPRTPWIGGTYLNSAEFTDGDRGFLGFNNRLRPDQLTQGMLADAQNVRIDRNNEIQVRKGLELKANASLSTANSLTLPFTLTGDEVDVSVAISGGDLVITNLDASGFIDGDKVMLKGFYGITPDPNGARTATKDSDSQITISDQTYSSATVAIDEPCVTFYGNGNGSVIVPDNAELDVSSNLTVCIWAKNNNASVGPIEVIAGKFEWYISIYFGRLRVTLSADGINQSIWESTGTITANNWNHYAFVYIGGTSLSVYLNGSLLPGSFIFGSLPTSLYNGTANLQFGSTTSLELYVWNGQMCDARIYNSSLSAASIATIYNDGTNPSPGTIAAWYPMTEGLEDLIVDVVNYNDGTFTDRSRDIWANTQDVFTLQAVGIENILNDLTTNKIYGSTAFSDPNDNESAYIILATNSKAIAINVVTGATTDIAYPSGLVVISDCDVLQAFNKVFIFREGQTAFEWDGDLSGTPAFTKVPSGTYSQPALLKQTNNTVISDGLATVTQTSHGLAVGDKITLVENPANPSLVEQEFTVSAVPDANTFKYHITDDDAAAYTAGYMKKQSVGLGYTHMPAPPYAIYHQRRLVMPYWYSVDAAADSYTDRGIRDELVGSDILDSDTYDTIYANYRFNAGTADYNVGLASFAEDRILVFNRNSIHIIENTTDLSLASARLLTDEVGCVSRQSITQVGNRVIFLSDNGVYSTEFIDEYNLRGTETPLSEPINETIKRINKNYWHNAVSVYFDNRYYIAVPLDDSTVNNAVLVYNFFNQQWESIDTVADANFDYKDLIIAGNGSDRGVFVVTSNGTVYRFETRLDGVDRVITTIGGTQQSLLVAADITTRQYTANAVERKKFSKFELQVQSSDERESNFDISVITENRDTSETLGQLIDYNDGADLAIGSDVSIRGRIGNKRSYGLQFRINNTTGRARIKLTEVNGTISFKSLKKAE